MLYYSTDYDLIAKKRGSQTRKRQMAKLIKILSTLNGIMDQVDGDMEELQFLRNVLINGDSDIESENDTMAICTRIAELEKRIK